MQSYLFCEAGCSHSAKKDGLTESEIEIARGLWPKIRSSFALLFKEIPYGAWLRTIHFLSYSRSIGAKYHYEKSAYGRFALFAGATAFSGAFVATEIAETLFAGPLHIVCQANYLWSLAIASSVASLSRDVKAVLSFNAKNESFMKRLFGAYGRYSLLRNERAIEDRILFQTNIIVANGSEKKVTSREARIQKLTPILEAELVKPIRRNVALDALLWSELLKPNLLPSQDAGRFKDEWNAEFDRLNQSSELDVRLWWHDLHASLRTMLRIQKFQAQAEHTMGTDRKMLLSRLGVLDRSLRLWDTATILSLSKTGSWNSSGRDWLRSVTGEWLALLLLAKESDAKTFELREKYLEEIMKIASRAGGFHSAGMDGLPPPSRLGDAIEARSIGRCEAAFTATTPF